MKIFTNISAVFLLGTLFAIQPLMAQNLGIFCPPDDTVSTDSGICAKVYNYATPVALGGLGFPCSDSAIFNFTDSIELWVIPNGVTELKIEVIGAQGANNGGLGAQMIGDFGVVAGDTLQILVGEEGIVNNSNTNQAGGGGGSFVATINDVPLIVAGGGGGRAWDGIGVQPASPGINANITTNGNNGYSELNGQGSPNNQRFGIGGVNGNGSTNGFPALGTPHAGNAGGFYTDGVFGACGGSGEAFVNGGEGGTGCTVATGGFGGGGEGGNWGGGGGGGYSGGGGSWHGPTNGGGGGSFNSGVNQDNLDSVGTGDGMVIIRWNCTPLTGGITVTQIAGIGPGGTFPLGTTVETWVANDTLGNTDTCSFSVTVEDNIPPVVVCPPDDSLNTDPGICGAIYSYPLPLLTDNCEPDTVLLLNGFGSGGIFPVGTTIEAYTGSDISGNTSICQFNIIVNDNEIPTITCPADVVSCHPVVTGLAPIAMDNCPGYTVTYTQTGATTGSGSNNASGTYDVGVTTVEYVITDPSGNTTNCSFTITINETYDDVVDFVSICDHDSIFVGGAWQTQGGSYIDSLTSVGGCDSVVNTLVSIISSFNQVDTVYIPQGMTYFVGGAEQSTPGTYVDQFTAANGCDSTVTTELIFTTGIDDLLSAEGISITPNPATDVVYVNAQSGSLDVRSIQIMDIRGREYINLTQISGASQEIQLSELPEGVYLVKVNLNSGKQLTSRLVKTN